MSKKIESEQDIEKAENQDIEIEFLVDEPQAAKKKSAGITPKATAADKSLKAKLKKKDSEIEEMKAEIEELKSEYLRMAAEKDNLRKRVEREKNEFLQYALSEYLKELLGVLDNFERALEAATEDDYQGLREGIELIYKQYVDILTRHGVKPVELEDDRFDPHVHQAFMSEESDKVKEPTVAEELQRGYMLNDRLLRPTLVKVLLPKRKEK